LVELKKTCIPAGLFCVKISHKRLGVFWTPEKAGLRQPAWFSNPLVLERNLPKEIGARPTHAESGQYVIGYCRVKTKNGACVKLVAR